MNNEYERAKIFFESKILVHAGTEKFFTNGIILEVGENHIIIKDRYDGRERLILFTELNKPLEKFTEKVS